MKVTFSDQYSGILENVVVFSEAEFQASLSIIISNLVLIEK